MRKLLEAYVTSGSDKEQAELTKKLGNYPFNNKKES